MSSIVRPACFERLLGRRDRPGTHDLGLDADEAYDTSRIFTGSPSSRAVSSSARGRGRAVVDARRIAGGHLPVRAERRLQGRERRGSCPGASARRDREPPALLGLRVATGTRSGWIRPASYAAAVFSW